MFSKCNHKKFPGHSQCVSKAPRSVYSKRYCTMLPRATIRSSLGYPEHISGNSAAYRRGSRNGFLRVPATCVGGGGEGVIATCFRQFRKIFPKVSSCREMVVKVFRVSVTEFRSGFSELSTPIFRCIFDQFSGLHW